MKEDSFLKSKIFKGLLPIIIICIAISLFKSGVDFGQWIYELIH